MAKPTRQRIPKLRYTSNRGIGWHVSYRHPSTCLPVRHRFGITERERESEARARYHAWLAAHLAEHNGPKPSSQAKAPAKRAIKTNMISGSILEIASSLLESERARARGENEPRRRGTIVSRVLKDRTKQIHDFLEFLNGRHGNGAVARMCLADLSMDDVEAYNAYIVQKGYSASQVSKRIQLVKAIIDRGGRPEHGRQVLTWNWDSRDVAHGLPARERMLPTVEQLRRLLNPSPCTDSFPRIVDSSVCFSENDHVTSSTSEPPSIWGLRQATRPIIGPTCERFLHSLSTLFPTPPTALASSLGTRGRTNGAERTKPGVDPPRVSQEPRSFPSFPTRVNVLKRSASNNASTLSE